MSQYFSIHEKNPQQRLIHRAVEILHKGGVVVYPTDSSYALGCHMGDKTALDRIRRIRALDFDHHFTLMCRDLSELGRYSQVSNASYRLLKALTPGPFTFLLKATKEVPRRLQHSKRKTIGLRVPDNSITAALLEAHRSPLMTATLQLPDAELPLFDPSEIREILQHHVDLVIDGGNGGIEPTTVIDLTGSQPLLLRLGKGDPLGFV